MNIIQLIEIYKSGDGLDKLIQIEGLKKDSEVIEVFSTKPFSIDTELSFVEIEESEGKIKFEINGLLKYNLFDLFFFEDFIEDSEGPEHNNKTNEQLAKVLLDYAVNDA